MKLKQNIQEADFWKKQIKNNNKKNMNIKNKTAYYNINSTR